MDTKDELKAIVTSKPGVMFIIMMLRLLAEQSENTVDDAIVDGIERALAVYL